MAYLNCTEFLVDDLDHAFYFLGCNWSSSALLSEEIHDMGGELVTALVVLFNLLLVYGSDLSELILVVRMLNCCAVLSKVLRGRGSPLFWTHDSFSHQHIIQPHKLWVGWIVVLDISETKNCTFLNFTQHGEQGRFHSVAVQRVFSGLMNYVYVISFF